MQLAVAAKKDARLVQEIARQGKVVARQAQEIAYLKSASGAGRTLVGFRN
ncbi:hypothetical protein AB0I39_27340 [Kitasatospora purpeofusca]